VPWLRWLVARILIAESRVRARVTLYGVCGRQSGTGTSFLRVFRFSLSISFHHGTPYWYITWGWTIGLLAAAVQRHRLIPSTWTTTGLTCNHNSLPKETMTSPMLLYIRPWNLMLARWTAVGSCYIDSQHSTYVWHCPWRFGSGANSQRRYY
jgi:hypothetical protein